MSGHTEGPWGTNPCSTETQYRVEVHAGGVPLALLSCAVDDAEAIPVVAFDALLMAAGPDLLKALRILHPEPGRWRTPNTAEAEFIQTVMAKAQGR